MQETRSAKAKQKARTKPKYDGKQLSLEEFLEFKAEDGFKYEWNSGFLEAKKKMIKPSEIYIVENLRSVFEQTELRKQGGAMVTEAVCPISEGKYRVPDIAFFTKEQIAEGREGKFPVPKFVVELMSESDRVSYYEHKLSEYFLSGVQCVWLISLSSKRVWIFTSPKEVKICTDEDICSAEPAVPDFKITPNQLFA